MSIDSIIRGANEDFFDRQRVINRGTGTIGLMFCRTVSAAP